MLPTKDIHQDFANDQFFGKVVWDETQEIVCYGAEVKSSLGSAFGTFEYKQSWGEKFSGTINPGIFYLDLKTTKIEMIPCPAGFSPSCPSILPNGDIAFVGYANAPTKLGLHFCYNRPSQIFLWKRQTNETVSLYSDARFSVRSLNYSDGRLYFLRSKVGGSHFATSDLCYMDASAPPGDVIAMIKQTFAESISLNGLEHLIYFNEPSRSVRRYRIIDGATGKSWTPEGGISNEYSEVVLDLRFGWALIRRSSPTFPPTLHLCYGRDNLRLNMEVRYRELSPSLESIGKASFEIFRLSEFAEYILLKPIQPSGSLIVLIHGGPNSVYPIEWNFDSAAFVALGYTVITVNYVGSIGFGQAGVETLEGCIGERDIADVISAIEELEGRMGKYGKIILVGGSHGGYISAMLSGKYPERFTACIIRNPVVDLPSMSYATDILDWTFGQLGLSFSPTCPLPASEEQIMKLHQHSPSSYVQRVRAPTLVLIGEKDLRVPPFQGKVWHTWLKSMGVPTRLLAFPDAGHSLDTPMAEKNSFLAIHDFLISLNEE